MLNSTRFEADTLSTRVDLRLPETSTRDKLLVPVAVLLGFFALAVFLQFLNGAFHSEFNAYPDEPAHYVTSLMLREYLTASHGLAPMKFAEQYYHHYPKVAFGHWPPVFYIVQAFWMLLFSPGRTGIRLELALTTALLAFSVWREFRRIFGTGAALLAGALLVCLPMVQQSTDEEMAETLLVLFCFWTAIFFRRYLRYARGSDSVWFGLCASLAILTKGSAWLLVLIPPVALLLTRKLWLLKRGSFWLGPAIIAILCLPWQLLTLRSAQRGWAGTQPSFSYTLTSLLQFGVITIGIVGPVLSVLVGLGIFASFNRSRNPRRIDSMSAVMLALLASDWVFHSLVPAGVEDRKMIIAVPAILYFLFAGGIWLADHVPAYLPVFRWRRPLLAAAAGIVFAGSALSIPGSDHYGYDQAADFVVAQSAAQDPTLLVCSDSIGEGLLISEVAMRQPQPSRTILRGTKELAEMDWAGHHYRSRFQTSQELLNYLNERNVSELVTDSYSGDLSFPHQKLVEQTIQNDPEHFRPLAKFPGEVGARRGNVQIYQIVKP